jgi:hypothetical protein
VSTTAPPTDVPAVEAPNTPRSVGSKFPINRVVAFLGPYLAILSGVVADWLIVHVHLLSSFHTTATTVAGAITQVAVFALTALLTWAGQHKWLDGWQKYETAAVAVAGVAGVADQVQSIFDGPEVAPDQHPSAQGDYDPEIAGGDSAPVDPNEDPDLDTPEPPPASDDEALA